MGRFCYARDGSLCGVPAAVVEPFVNRRSRDYPRPSYAGCAQAAGVERVKNRALAQAGSGRDFSRPKMCPYCRCVRLGAHKTTSFGHEKRPTPWMEWASLMEGDFIF